MKKILIALALTGLITNVNAEQPSEASIRELMEKTGAGELGIQAMQGMITQLKPLLPAAPESFWEDVKQQAKPEDLINQVIPIYQKHLSQKDIDAAAAFYQTPEGKNFIEAQPKILQESMAAGQIWGKALAEDIVKKYKAEHQVQPKK